MMPNTAMGLFNIVRGGGGGGGGVKPLWFNSLRSSDANMRQ